MRTLTQRPLRPGVQGPPKASRTSGINGAKSCILGLSWHLISLLKLHFFVLFFSYIFFTFFYIFLITCITLCFLKKPSSEPCLHLCLLGAATACLIRVLLYRRNVYNFVKSHSELIAIFLKKLEKNREYVRQIIQSLSVYDFISDERKITTDIIRVRGYVTMFICKDLQA